MDHETKDQKERNVLFSYYYFCLVSIGHEVYHSLNRDMLDKER